MKIGYACTPLLVPYKTTRRISLKYYSEKLLIDTIKENLNDLLRILSYNRDKEIKMFRISSDIIPLGSHPINTFDWNNYFQYELNNIGKFIKNNSMRVSMHPGQYTVINSPKEDVVKKSILDLQYHAKFLDSLGIDSSHKIILHIGGVYGDKELAIKRFMNVFKDLDKNIKNRLVIENDEKNFSIDDVLFIGENLSIPVVFDNLHNECFNDNNYSISNILKRVKKTWNKKDGNIKVHYSQQNPLKKLGAHSQSLNITNFLYYLDLCKDFELDIMLEVKDKNISAIKAVNSILELSNALLKENIDTEFKNYKFILLEQGENILYEGYNILNKNTSLIEFYKFIDSFMYNEILVENKTHVLKLLENELKSYMTSKESNHFYKLLKERNFNKCKEYLYKIACKYHIELSKNYYFYNN
ncbi:UV DNA damage repair endonuclease UvsE [Clostridium septicum]|uniref:UV DNA damage repair endonuclease UvsE n=1 Tax=Clostridium septicum TaxID=1504 RepID=A0A9N7JIU0_CLOSE|nr:UV DNA damage repair endonuclease UvsE [Clostridium septicum]AYE33478.1 UV damage repair endonuclease UvsE [Clostridium septicum]QAS61649.1 UV DNA damage repair endonuclease UvsE [Clostridium septicum]UEC21913.1 UV DNA damage repair endonuclease UvsE [Clostridium septicum]USS00056.1 UV DNA damage repair endonuclease UvsE [Clostridium septicum]WLF68582.1 UV DNA damage repair endonuclease UvsE [Clostridium septicum]